MAKPTIIKMSDFTQGKSTNDILYLNVNPNINYKTAKDLMIEVPPSHRVKVTFGGSVMGFENGIREVFDNRKEAKIIKQGASFSIAYLPKNYFIKLLWGTPDKFSFKDNKTGVEIQIGASGEAEVRLVDPDLFVDRVIGNNSRYTKFDFEEMALQQIVSSFSDIFANTVYSEQIEYTEFVLRQKEIGNAICRNLNHELTKKYGFEFSSFIISRFMIDGLDSVRAYNNEDIENERLLKNKAVREEKERIDDKEWERKKYLYELNQRDKEAQYGVARTALGENDNRKGSYFCPNCGHSYQPSQAFCPGCGKRLNGGNIACPSCGHINDGSNAFCSKCGKKL